eukprot:6062571-Prymnesium_polylepis.1
MFMSSAYWTIVFPFPAALPVGVNGPGRYCAGPPVRRATRCRYPKRRAAGAAGGAWMRRGRGHGGSAAAAAASSVG